MRVPRILRKGPRQERAARIVQERVDYIRSRYRSVWISSGSMTIDPGSGFSGTLTVPKDD